MFRRRSVARVFLVHFQTVMLYLLTSNAHRSVEWFSLIISFLVLDVAEAFGRASATFGDEIARHRFSFLVLRVLRVLRVLCVLCFVRVLLG